MTPNLAGMAARFLCFPAGLLTRLADVFTFPQSVALLAAEVRATFEFLPTYFATANLCEPAGLILECLLSAKTRLLCQKWALWTSLLIIMTVVRNAWMATILGSFTIKATWRRRSTTRKRWLQHCPATVTADLIKDRFSAASARPFMT